MQALIDLGSKINIKHLNFARKLDFPVKHIII